jgi:phosphoribosylformylglycinamidine cyclo-ligase
LYVHPSQAEKIISISKGFNIDAQIVGRVEKSNQRKLTIQSPYGIFEW